MFMCLNYTMTASNEYSMIMAVLLSMWEERVKENGSKHSKILLLPLLSVIARNS